MVQYESQLYHPTKDISSARISARVNGTMMTRIASLFSVRKNRSMTAILPCWPTAPYRGFTPCRSHHARYSLQNCGPWSVTVYFGA